LSQDRFLVNPRGYFIELPDGSLAPISPRVTFPIIRGFASVVVDDVCIKSSYSNDARFLSVPLTSPRQVDPIVVPTEELEKRPLKEVPFLERLENSERYILLRALEAGIIPWSAINQVMAMKQGKYTVGEVLIHGGFCHWERLLSYCLDNRPPSKLDPIALRQLIEHKEWELIGEILISLGRINRTQLEQAVKIKREGSQAIGQILTAMGACSEEVVEQCLKVQNELRDLQGPEIALIGNLLVKQGYISADDLEDALRNQRIARQSLGRILVSMGACTQLDIDSYTRAYAGFQSEIDDIGLGNHLVKTDAISKTQLEEALRIQMRGRQVLGEILVSMGLCSSADIEKVLKFQQEVRDSYRSGVEKLGALLLKTGKVTPAKIEEAIHLQELGRQPFGAILVAFGACAADDVQIALSIQQGWRDQAPVKGDRLGEVLLKESIITESQLQEPLLKHLRESKPLGRILVEEHVCTPEQIIGVLVARDYQRQKEFFEYVRQKSPIPLPKPISAEKQNTTSSFMTKISSWFNKRGFGA
jgi:hypothetical protein